MVKSRKKTRPWAGRGLTAAALAALLATGGLYVGPLGAAEITVNNAADFKTTMEGLSDGDTVFISSDVEALDLAGVSVEVTASGVTLEGAASFDLGTAIKAQAGLILSHVGDSAALSQSSLNAALSSLTDTLLDNLPSTNIYNSAAESGTHAGISASQGGFSLKNLTLMGTTANIDAASGASKYMGLIASTYNRYDSTTDPTDGQGLGVIENVAFVNNVVNSTGAVHNVGNSIFFTQRRYDSSGTYVAGADRIETMDGLIGSVFIGNKMYADMTASVGNRDVGGGGAGWVNLTRLDSTIFADNFLQGHHAFGAGLFVYSLGEVTDSVFYNNILESDHDAYGGGLMSSGGIDSISGSVFVGNEARGLDFGLGRASAARGGAVHSTSAVNTSIMDDPVSRAGIGLIENSLFAYNRVYNETGEEAMGGAVSAGRNLGEIKNTVFYSNSAENNAGADGVAYGGAIALDVNASGMVTTITDSLFWNNSVTSSSGNGGGGAISLGLTSAAATSYTLSLAATSGGLTEFSGNTYNGDANSIYFGKHDANASQTDVTLNVLAAAQGTVALLDPVVVELDNNKTFTLTNHSTGGKFIWGGVNDLNADGGSYITFESGSNATLKENFHLHSSNSDSITIDLDNGANLTMLLSGRNRNMALFEGADIVNSSGAALSAVYYGFTDQSGSWVLSDHDTTAQATDLTLTDYYDSLTGAASTLTLSTSGTQTIVNLSYQAPTLAYASAGPNASLGRYALQDVWNTILAPYLSADEQGEYYNRIINDLRNYTAEVFASQATVALSSSYRITSQALSSNNRSWSSSYGPSQPAFGDQDGRVRLWADYIGSRIDQDRRNGYSGYDVHNNGAVFGLSYDFNRVWSLGGYMSVSDGETTYDDIRAKVDTNIFQSGLFATYKAPSNGLGAILDLAYARMDNDSSRRFIGDLYEASFDQSVVSLGLEVNYELNPWENGRLIPFAGLRYQHLKQDSLQESTATGLMPLNVRSADGDTFTSTLGLALEHNFQFENGGVFTPRLTAAWRHEFGDRDISTRYDIAGVSLITKADSLEQAANSFDLGASFTVVPMKCGEIDFGLNGGYTASFSSDRLEHNFYGGVEIKF